MSAASYQIQLDRKRAAVARRLARSGQTCSIRRPNRDLSPNGRPTGHSIIATGVACLLTRQRIQLTVADQPVDNELRTLSEFVLLLPWDAGVRGTDYVEFPNGRVFEIVAGVGDITPQWVYELTVIEINPGYGAAGAVAGAGFELGLDGTAE